MKGKFVDGEAILKNAKKRFTTKQNSQVQCTCTCMTRCQAILYITH